MKSFFIGRLQFLTFPEGGREHDRRLSRSSDAYAARILGMRMHSLDAELQKNFMKNI